MGGMTGVNGAEPGYEGKWYAWVEIPKDAQGSFTGYTPEGGWTDAPLEDKLRGIRSGLLFGYVDTLKVYHCPSDRRSVRVIEPAEYPAWRSYSVGGGMNVESPYVVDATNIDQIKSPSRRYVFVENDDPRGWNMGYWDIWVPSRNEARWWSIPAGWHEDRCNWGFADGHARPQHWRDERTIEICGEFDYPTQISMREYFSIENSDLQWIVDRRMNDWD